MNDYVLKMWFAGLPVRHVVKQGILENNIPLEVFWSYNKKDYINLGVSIIEAEEIE